MKKMESSAQMIRHLVTCSPGLVAQFRSFSVKRFEAVSGLGQISIIERSKWDEFCYGSRLAMITIAGLNFQVMIKVHFDPQTCLQAFSSDRTIRWFEDCLREYCNLLAGAIKKVFQSHDILCGISLPIVTAGYDEIFFSDQMRPNRLTECFDIKFSNGGLTMMMTLDVLSDMVERVIRGIPDSDLESEEIEFL